MDEHPRVRIGHSMSHTVWAVYYTPTSEQAEYIDPLTGTPEAIVLWHASSENCYCGNCSIVLGTRACPKLEEMARVQHRHQQELHPDYAIKVDAFEAPAYFTPRGRVREVINQLLNRHDPSGGSGG